MSDKRVYINHDLTVREREMQKQIRHRAQMERKDGKTVKVGIGRVTIGEDVWKWNRDTNSLERAKN